MSSAGLIKMLMCLKGEISLPEEPGKKGIIKPKMQFGGSWICFKFLNMLHLPHRRFYQFCIIKYLPVSSAPLFTITLPLPLYC